MKIFTFIFLILSSFELLSQIPDISTRWEAVTIDRNWDQYRMEELDNEEYFQYDFSSIISNQIRLKGDPWSTYIGVFGPKNRRIDFHLTASKSSKKTYNVIGKSRLGKNIRDLKGEITLKYAVKTGWEANVMIFEYKLQEPGDKEGDGKFVGLGSLAFLIRDGKPKMFWAESGDFREFNNIFVGTWDRFNSDVSRECMFAFNPSGTHMKLPFRDYLYKEFEEGDECKCYFEFKDELKQYGWEEYDDSDNYKTNWWEK